MIVGQVYFSQVEFFSLKIFQGGPPPSKHAKFKSKKQNFLDFEFFLHEAYIWTSKAPHKRWTSLGQKRLRKRRF